MTRYKLIDSEPISLNMINILGGLLDGQPRPLSCHKRTRNALEDRDWIVEDQIGSGLWRITKRGQRAWKLAQRQTRRSDGICPTCAIRPTGYYRTGKKKAYCDECMAEHQRKQRQMKGQQANVRTCPRCKKRPVHVCSTGFIKSYCQRCLKTTNRQSKKRIRQQLLKKVLSGVILPCPKCGKPRYISGRTVQDYCYEHYRSYQNTYQRQARKGNL